MSTKKIFISGGSRGIGRSITLKFAQEGYQVLFTYKNSDKEALELIDYIVQNYNCPLPQCYKCDMSDAGEVKQLFKENKEEFSSIYTLVNNVGGQGKLKPFMFCSNEYFQEILGINLMSVVNTVREVLPIFIRNKEGRIVNITSIAGTKGNPGHSAYATSKGAIIGFSKSIVKEVGGMGVIINSVAPGFVQTESIEDVPEKYLKQRIDNSIYKRMGMPEEIANVAYYLGTSSPEYLTGQEIIVDGGITG
ncbi:MULTISPECIES: SDR family oxidoreductase [unclassified Chryseobacterium]|uniref:SDR family oxidoreductase n=1 Tax=unclassified Chryseobacterium TaxID=2593645 RepID=UPI000D3C1562|nr:MULTISPECIES: SDR family oxidoreductase [unclassified Chryseobacterium]PTT35803.1 beta-ketoacyl-ACP reductase [Chryseobacterium sp. HMWF028]PTT75374.1 beta-ketoacyl-ACP reductase [Chryseobacterium sp. HMWF001]PVV61180.1 KR domain-containing protein [Chryseobacterium sp. HMWF035]